jgi:hypothetical protein
MKLPGYKKQAFLSYNATMAISYAQLAGPKSTAVQTADRQKWTTGTSSSKTI